MTSIKVLVVDDSVVVRRLVADVLVADPDIEVVGTAANGRIALAKIPQLNPDVITLDIEMPIMDGLQTLAELRKTNRRLPVIMLSTLTSRGAAATLDALSLGASDYVTKPSNTGSFTESQELIREELIPKIRALASRAGIPTSPSSAPVQAQVPRVRPASPSRIDVVAIGVSTGGPNALGDVVPALPADLPVPMLIVQHMPPLFTQLLAERLDSKSGLRVTEGAQGDLLARGQVTIAPGGHHMVIERHNTAVRIAINDGPPENSCRPAVDPLFRSVVATYGPHCLAVVLTGMGQDGLRGCEAVAAAGGQVLVQDEATSVVWGMPGFVSRAGLADAVVPLDRVAGEIVRRVGKRRTVAETTTAQTTGAGT